MKNYTLRLKNTSEAELQRFDQFMLQILRENYERKKAKAELNKFTPNYAITQHKTASKTIQKKAQPAPQKINKRGFIVAENGIRLHHTPTADDAQYMNKKGNSAKVYKLMDRVTVVQQEAQNKGWYKVKTLDNQYGYIEKRYIQIIPHHAELDRYTRTFLYVKSNYTFEKNIANFFFPNYQHETGNDKRTIAEAFHLINTESKHNHGIILQNALPSIELAHKAAADPSFHKARTLYAQLQLTQGHIVRIPTVAYIKLQQKRGILSKRSKLMNATIKTGRILQEFIDGALGLIAGIIEGIGRGIYDMLEGLLDSMKQIIDTIKDLFTGKLFSKFTEMYENILKLFQTMTPEKIKTLLIGMLGGMAEQVMKTINNWRSASSFEKGRVIGLVLGNVLLEVLLAIFTGGSANMAKWATKLGKLGKILLKVVDFTHDIKAKLKAKLPKKYFQKGDYDKDPDDTKNWMRWALLAEARMTAKKLDDNGATKEALLAQLKRKAKKYPSLKVKWNARHSLGNTYAITMTASPTKTVDAHFTSGEKDIDSNAKKIIGKDINAIKKNPKGYQIVEVNNKKQIKRLNIDDPKTPRLEIAPDGKIREYSGAKSKRISNSKKFRSILKTPKGHQGHHLVADNIVQTSNLHTLARNKKIYDLDRKGNGVNLAETLDDFIFDETGLSKNLPLHKGSHPQWDKRVKEIIKVKENELKRRYGKIESPPIPLNVLEDYLLDIEDDLLDLIKTLPKGKKLR